MKKPVVGILVLGVFAVAIFAIGRGVYEADRRDAQETPLWWARMAEIPEELRVISVGKKGSMFTREFVVIVSGDPDDLEDWMRGSPGILDSIKTQDGRTTIYRIKPGGGTAFAEATYDLDKRRLTIRAYWS